MDNSCIELAALGRPLYPGMLYDCCKDCFISGVTLWEKKTINEHLDVHSQPKTDLKFCSSDDLNEKAKLLDISASLKASFLCGLVEVGGSAKYMNDTKSSEHQCRVTLQYSQTTKFEQLCMAELGKIIYPQVFEQQAATHVVTGVQYGAQAFMVFDYPTSTDEKKKDINGAVEGVVKMIPNVAPGAEAKLKLNETEKQVVSKMNVTFYGDYELDENPTTFMEALQTYKKLPSLLKKMDNDGVPLKVWLFPLKFLNNKAAQLMKEISTSEVSKTDALVEELRQVKRRCNDMLNDSRVDSFSEMKKRLQKFQALLQEYNIELNKKLFAVLPAIRAGTKEEKTLIEIINAHQKSWFKADNMNKWLDDLSTEVDVLSSYTRELKDIQILKGSINPILFDPHLDAVVCLSFTSLDFTDPYLEDLAKYNNQYAASNVGYLNSLPTASQTMKRGGKPNIVKTKKKKSWFRKSVKKPKKGKDLQQNSTQEVLKPEEQNEDPEAMLELIRRVKQNHDNRKLEQTHRWFASHDISDRMRLNLSLFTSFYKGNKHNKRIQFLIASIPDSKNPGSSIQLYEQGRLTDAEYIPVSKPPPPIADPKDVKINLKLQKPPTGVTQCFRVEYKMVKGDKNKDANKSEDQDEPWDFAETQNDQSDFTLTNLQPKGRYLIRYKAISAFGQSEASNTIRVSLFSDSNLVSVGCPEDGEAFLSPDATLKSIHITTTRIQISSVRVKLSTGEERVFGTENKTESFDFEFEEGDVFKSVQLSARFRKTNAMKFIVEDKSQQKKEFFMGVNNVLNFDRFSKRYDALGSGICCGVKVKSKRNVDVLGFYFLK